MNIPTPALSKLVNGEDFASPEFLGNISETAKDCFGIDSKEIVQSANRQQLGTLKKKSKAKDYSLYSLFQSVQGLLDQCKPTTDEMFVLQENGTYILSQSAEVISKTSSANHTLLLDAMELFSEVVGEPELLRKSFIKEKVVQNRYTRRGAEYATLFNNVGDKIFALSTQCLNIQMILADLIKQYPETEEA